MSQTRRSALIIGANGYVGYTVAITLARAGYKVYGSIRKEKYSDYLALQEVIPVVGDFENTEWTEKLGPIDVIINATEDLKEPEKSFDKCFQLITKIAKKQASKPLVIHVSGIKIYGETGLANEPGFHSVNEESPYNPTPKFLSYRVPAVERLMASDDFYAASVIPGMIYGRGQSGYADFIKQALNGNKIEVFGKPNTVWHSVHVDDLAEVFVMLADLADKAHGRKYNVANDKYEKMEDILKAISNECGGKHEIVYKEPKKETFEHLISMSAWINSDKVKKELGWKPKRAYFIDGVKENIMVWKASDRNEFVSSSCG